MYIYEDIYINRGEIKLNNVSKEHATCIFIG
jgi:hypothetical protein